MHLAWGTATDRGRVRTVNQDALLAEPPVFLVADGMGGYQAGEAASRIVVEEFTALTDDSVTTAEGVLGGFARANARIRADTAGGTTVAGAAAVQQNGADYWLIFNVGDSRVYHASHGVLTQISVDHSVVQELVDHGELDQERARFHPQRHIITRAVGSADAHQADFWLLPAQTGDRLMICSDGVTSEMGLAQIRALTVHSAGPQEAADSLVACALTEGGRDNITVVVVDVLSSNNSDIESTAATADTHTRTAAAAVAVPSA